MSLPTAPQKTVPISPDAFQGLIDRVTRLGEAKNAAESATGNAQAKRQSLMEATVDSAEADAHESAANQTVTACIDDLKAYVSTLTPAPTPTT